MVNGQEEDSGISCIIRAQFYSTDGPCMLGAWLIVGLWWSKGQSKSLEIFIRMPKLREPMVIRSTFCIFPLEKRK